MFEGNPTSLWNFGLHTCVLEFFGHERSIIYYEKTHNYNCVVQIIMDLRM